MRGVSGAYLTYAVAPGLLEATVVVAQAAAEAGVRSVVAMSQISARREAASNQARQHWLAERLLDRAAMLTAHLKPTFFAEWIIEAWGLQGDHGVLRLPFGTAPHAPAAGVDQSYVIAAILEHPEPHDRQCPMTGILARPGGSELGGLFLVAERRAEFCHRSWPGDASGRGFVIHSGPAVAGY